MKPNILMTPQFKQAFKLLKKKHQNNILKDIIKVIEQLVNFEITTQKSNHPLSDGINDLHIRGDVILLYRYQGAGLIIDLNLLNISDHKELQKNLKLAMRDNANIPFDLDIEKKKLKENMNMNTLFKQFMQDPEFAEAFNEPLEEELIQSSSTKVQLIESISDMKKYYPNISEDNFTKYLELDPTYKQGSDKAGQYAKWILGLANKNSGKLDGENHITDIITRFDKEKKHLKDKDIMRFKSIEDLENYLNADNNYNDLSHRQEVRQRQRDRHNVDLSNEAKLIYEDEYWLVYIPLTYAASCKLGQGAAWCTASTESSAYYDMYAEYGDLVIIISKIDPNEKYQLSFGSDSFMDSKNNKLILSDFFTRKNTFNLLKFFSTINKDIQLIYKDINKNFDVMIYPEDFVDNPSDFSGRVKKIIFADNVTVIDEYSFMDCIKIKSISLPNSVTKILENAFWGCTNLEYVELPESLEYIGWACFSDCPKLSELHFDGTSEQWLQIKKDPEWLEDSTIKTVITKNNNLVLTERLIQCSSNKALQQNIKTEIDSGKSPKQAAAIAYSIQRKNESMNLKENTITGTLPPSIDKFLADMSQIYIDDLSYTDITNFGDRATEEDLKQLNRYKRELSQGFEEDDPEIQEIFKNIKNIVKGNLEEAMTNRQKLMKRFPELNLNEAVNPSKALDVKKTSDAYAILYGWKYKNNPEVEIEPEEHSEQSLKARIRDIISEQGLHNDGFTNTKPKESDFIFYVLYNNKPNMSEALHGKDEIDEFFKICNLLGIKTLGDLEKFADANKTRIEVNKLLSEFDSNMSTDAFFETLRDYKKEYFGDDQDDFEYDDPLNVMIKKPRKDENLSLKENKLNKEEILDWLSEHEIAWEDFINYFEDIYQSSAEVPMDEILGWISEHDTLAEDFENRFGISVNADVYDDFSEEEIEEHLAIDAYNQLNSPNILEINTTKHSRLKESTEGKWNIGSNKLVSTDSQEYANLVDLAKLLQERSPNGYEYRVEKTYEDFGAGMQWYTIICDEKNGWGTHQVLDTKQWLDLANTGDIESVYQDIVSNKYFRDKPGKTTASIFNYMDDLED